MTKPSDSKSHCQHNHSDSQEHGSHHHHHHQGHSHKGHHHHHHHSVGSSKNLKWVFFLNLGFAVIELIGGFYTNSIAVISDAVHDFGDALAIGLSWALDHFSHKGSSARFSYGFRRLSTLGALLIGLILILSSVYIIIQAVPRLLHPEVTEADGMFWLALLGISVNGFAAYRVSQGQSLNEKMVMWHMIEDLLGWILVLVSSVVIKFWKIYELDAGLAIALAIWIIYNVFRHLNQTLRVFLQGTPDDIEISEVENRIKQIDFVSDVHHSHLWTMDGQSHIYTGHVVIDSSMSLLQAEQVKRAIKQRLVEMGVFEATIEIEVAGAGCSDPSHA